MNQTKTITVNNTKLHNVQKPIYRYNFTNEFITILHNFSKVHQYDHRKDFKAAWDIWSEENYAIIHNEIEILNKLGYNGDILDKMFTSARYYFRKKNNKENTPPTKRKSYSIAQKELRNTIDLHIINKINEIHKPSDCFDNFCMEHIDIIREQVYLLCSSGITSPIEIKSKIKKLYKNRWFIFNRQTCLNK